MNLRFEFVAGDAPRFEHALALRRLVFVEEQGVPEELELDERDAGARHLVALEGDTVVGTLRILGVGEVVKIGRVAVRRDRRGAGLGARMMIAAIESVRASGAREILLGSQVVAQRFYARLGFVAEGAIYDDAGIPHVRMRLTLSRE